MKQLNNHLLDQYEVRFGMTFSLFSVHEKNVEKVNQLMESALRNGEPFYDRFFAPTSKSVQI